MLPEFNKDFYRFIPKWMTAKLDTLIERYSDESWFEKAWYTYRDVCLSRSLRNIPDPGSFFMDIRDTEVLSANDTEDDMGEVLMATDELDIPTESEDEEMFLDGEIVRSAGEMSLDIPEEPSTDEFTFVGTREPDEKD